MVAVETFWQISLWEITAADPPAEDSGYDAFAPEWHAGQSEYTHGIEQVPASEVPAGAEVFQYATLSTEAKAAIHDARTDDGIVYGEANKPPEFFYSDHAELNRGIYYRQQDGTYYRLTTYAGGGLFPIDLFLRWGLVLLGLGIGLLGYVSLQDRHRWLPMGVGVSGGLLLVETVVQPGRGTVIGVDSGPLLLLTFVGIVAALVAFGITARRSLALRTVAVFAGLFVVGSGLWLLRQPPFDRLFGVLVNPITLVVLALIPGLITAGYLGQRAYHQVGA